MHVNETFEEKSFDIRSRNLRNPKACRYFQHFRRCKFSDCKFKHVEHEKNTIEQMKKENENLIQKISTLDEKLKQLDFQEKLLEIEDKLANFANFEKLISKKG
jgi:hypothetical protein